MSEITFVRNSLYLYIIMNAEQIDNNVFSFKCVLKMLSAKMMADARQKAACQVNAAMTGFLFEDWRICLL